MRYSASGRLAPIGQHFLHAADLTLRLPSSGEERAFTSELPEELASVLKSLRST